MEWVHEFADNSRSITSQFESIPAAAPMTVTTVKAEPDWFNLGAGLQMNFAQSLAAFLEYVYTYAGTSPPRCP